MKTQRLAQTYQLSKREKIAAPPVVGRQIILESYQKQLRQTPTFRGTSRRLKPGDKIVL